MLIFGTSKSKKTDLLVEKYSELIAQGVRACDILVLVQNSYKKSRFWDAVLADERVDFLENPKIYTFFGLAYAAVPENWAFVEENLKNGPPVILPNQCGLEVSELFMKSAIKETGFADYNSKINLLHQLFRRNSLIVQNALTHQEVAVRSEVLEEAFGEDAGRALELFKKKSAHYRAFDYLGQLNIFNFIYKNTDYFKNIKYVFLDDGDEITNAEFEFLKHIKPQITEFFIALDPDGVSRAGFLNGDFTMPQKLEALAGENPLILDKIGFNPVDSEISSYTMRLEMINSAVQKASELLKSGVKASEIVFVAPVIDTSLKFVLKENFGENSLQFISGSEKLVDNPLVASIITLLKIACCDYAPDARELTALIRILLQIPVKYCLPIVEGYKNSGKISFERFKKLEISDFYKEKINNFEKLLKKIDGAGGSLHEKAVIAFNALFDKRFEASLEKINFFVKQLADFEAVFGELAPAMKKVVLTQLENSIISENPPNSLDVEEEKIIVSTAQKIIDLGITRKHAFWLDVTSGEWVREDTGTIYNAWVFQKSRKAEPFTYEESLKLSQEKTKRQIRKLGLLFENIYAYASLFDRESLENTGGIEEYFVNRAKSGEITFEFTPREDQKPVLDYKKGKMAISAVPGAGKTTILLALVIKLLQNGVKPENIFVLTYMDSAARNFKERIKKICPNLNAMPNISTIHGLALRILKENSNSVKIGLETDFEVCDDDKRAQILHRLFAKYNIENSEFDRYDRAISALKLSCFDKLKKPATREAAAFLKFYKLYNSALRAKNLIDYDDMLVYSVKILENNPEIAAFYADLCGYIIEDEAQDSSFIQQKLINLLAQKHRNIIRCGDLNQSITSTFTNADREGFEKFINESKSVKMSSSQRCNNAIFGLANRLIDYAKNDSDLKNAFFDIKMQEVKGANPKSEKPLNVRIYEDYKEEREAIISALRAIFAENKDAKTAILVRNNFQIGEYEQFLAGYGFTVITRSDYLGRQPVFNLLLALLGFCEHPWRNDTVLEFMKALSFQKLSIFTENDFEYVENLKNPFILAQSDDLPSKKLAQLLWDLNYWLENSFLQIKEFAIKAGNYYYSTQVELSNLHIIASYFKRLSLEYKANLYEKLVELAKKPAACKLFAEDSAQNAQGQVCIMTFHKSKGDEFDFVFIPGLCEETLPLVRENYRVSGDLRFIEHIKALNPAYTPKDENELQIRQIEENFRLMYVALTRAKKGLYISCARKYKKYSKIKNVSVSTLFDDFLGGGQ